MLLFLKFYCRGYFSHVFPKSKQHSLCYTVNYSKYFNELYDFHKSFNSFWQSHGVVIFGLSLSFELLESYQIGKVFWPLFLPCYFLFPASSLIFFNMCIFPLDCVPLGVDFFVRSFIFAFSPLTSFLWPVSWVHRLFWLVKPLMEPLGSSIQVLFVVVCFLNASRFFWCLFKFTFLLLYEIFWPKPTYWGRCLFQLKSYILLSRKTKEGT